MATYLRQTPLQSLVHQSWSWFLGNILLPAGDRLSRQGLVKRLAFLEQAQWWDRQQLDDYRATELQRLVYLTYREVPIYREVFDKLSLNPRDIRTPADLCKLPVLTKQMLRSGYPDRTSRPTGLRTFEARTSGSTGTNFAVLEDAQTAGMHRAAFMLALKWAGWHLGEPHVQTGITVNRNFERRLKDFLLRCNYVPANDLSDERLEATLYLLDQQQIQHLWGYPVSLYHLAQRAEKAGWNKPLKSIVTWGDNLYPHYRENIERVFRTRVFDTYGCGEGIQIAAQCGCDSIYHVHELDTIIEYVDEGGYAVKPGEPGHIVVTRLHPGPMPLIRYKVGDVGISGLGRSCKCGRQLEILDAIHGRDTDVIITPRGNRLIVHFFTGILEHFTEIDSFQVIQDELESITLRVQPTEAFTDMTAHKVVSALRDAGADLAIKVEVVSEISLTPGGKRRFVINNMTTKL